MISFDRLREKEVISAVSGQRLGFICDLEIDICTGCITAIILPPTNSCFAVFSKKNNIKIPVECIEKVGDDIILVKYCPPAEIKPKKH